MNQSNVHLEYTQKINQLMFGLLVLGFPTALILKWTGSDIPLWALAITFIVPAVIGGLHLKRLNPHVISLYTVMGVLGVASSLALTWAGDFSFVLMVIISLVGLYLELNYTLAAGVVLTGLMVWSHSHSGANGHWGMTLVAGLAITFAWSYLTQIIGQQMHLSKVDVSNDLGQGSRLDETLREIQAVSYDLDQEIMSFDENLANITESSNTFVMTLNELAQGATEQSNSVNEITNMVTGADQRISEISQLSSKLMVISEAAANHVGEGYQNILSMYNQMGSINYSVETSRHIIEQLSAYMDSINASLSAISQIASQTNLLALNAAIEAARAGESGRGFAVVAGEVKKLADQSSQTVSEITEALNFIRDKTHEVLIKSNEEREAVNTGAQIVEQVTNGFDSIKTAFDEIKAYIADEMNMVKDSESIFSGIRAEMESISSILEESAASSEEMLAHSQEQAASLEQIQNAIDQLKESSSQLHQMASQ